MKTILEKVAKQFMGRGIDKKFPILVWLYKKVYTHLSLVGEIETSIPLKLKLLVSSKDSGMGLMLRTKGVFEPLQSKLFIKSIKNGDTVFDVGANNGYYTVLASKLVGKNGKVYAFEPDPQSLKLIYKNLKLNNCKNVTVIESALGNKKGKLALSQDTSNPGESSLSHKNNGKNIMVDVTTLDNFIKIRKIKKIDLMQMDVEGSEVNVLRGSVGSIQNNKIVKIITECNPSALKKFGESKISLCSFLKGSGLKIEALIDEKENKIKKYNDQVLTDMLDKTGFTNLVVTNNKKSNNKSKISVLMAAYNSEKYVGAAIESILKQTYKNFEFIIVDDKSTDTTLEIIKNYAAKDKRIKVVSLKKNLGPSLAANIGLRKIKGQYLVRMDADDISEPDRLQKQFDFLSKNPEISMLGGQCKLINSEGSIIGRKLFPIDNKSITDSLFSRNPIQHPTCMINLKNMSKNAMLHDGKSVLAHDLELVFLASRCGNLANLDDFVLKYRQYPESFSLMNPKKTFWQTFKVRMQSVSKYRYVPTFKGIVVTLLQIMFVLLVPNKFIYPIYTYIRGMRKIDVRNVKINIDVFKPYQKIYQLATN